LFHQATPRLNGLYGRSAWRTKACLFRVIQGFPRRASFAAQKFRKQEGAVLFCNIEFFWQGVDVRPARQRLS